jgi:hypothetical protein
MTPVEFRERLVAFLHRRPFEPFAVELFSGERFVIDQPEAVSWGGSAAGCTAADGEVYLFDHTRTRQFSALSPAASA